MMKSKLIYILNCRKYYEATDYCVSEYPVYCIQSFPFILNSLDDVVIYDLEKHLLVEQGLSDVPYSGIVEGYFNADELSKELKEKFEKYKVLATKPQLDADDYEQIADLEMYLDEIPDYLALKLTTEYQELKTQLRAREG